jgi:hypothetical protein
MKLFKDLLLENPDTVYYKKKTYSYKTDANKCAFLVYKDEKSGKNAIFGYSLVKKDFYCDDPEVLKDVDELSKQPSLKLDPNKNSENQLDYWGQKAINYLKNSNSGGGHLEIENLLKGIGRFGFYADPLLKGRIFEVDDAKDVVDDSDLKIESTIPSGKGIIVTFWDSKRKEIANYKDQYDKVIEFNGYDPKECLYEPQMKFYTYDEFYKNEEPKPIVKEPIKPIAGTKASDYFKVGDKVKIKGMNVTGEVLSINAANNIKLKVTTSDLPTVTVGSEFDFPYYGLEPAVINNTEFKVGDKVRYTGFNAYGNVTSIEGNTIIVKITKSDIPLMPVGTSYSFPSQVLELDKSTQGELLDKVIHNKNKELVDKSGELHSKKTVGKNDDKPPTPAEKAKLEKEVNGLDFEIKILRDLLASGEKYYTDNVKDVVATSVQRKLHALEKEKQDRYSLVKQAEKQYGMPIAQIRQKYRNVPLDQLVKKESLYKKLLKALRG